MTVIKLSRSEKASAAAVLRQLGPYSANAALWADRMRTQMDRRDVQRVAWLLASDSRIQGLPRRTARSARRWGAHLQARI